MNHSQPRIAKTWYHAAVPTPPGHPYGNGYWAEWGPPGWQIDYVYEGGSEEFEWDETRREWFETAQEAEEKACWVMVQAKNSRYLYGPTGNRVEGKNLRHIKPDAATVSRGIMSIRDIISPFELAENLGTRYTTTPIDWMDGRVDAPFHLWGLLKIFKNPAVVAEFKEASAPHIIQKIPHARPPATADSGAEV